MVTLSIGRVKSTHATLAAAVQHHNAERTASGKGASTWPLCSVLMPSGTRYHISYNGRVWDRPYWKASNQGACVEITEHLANEARET